MKEAATIKWMKANEWGEKIPLKEPPEAEGALFEKLVAKRVGQASRLLVSESKQDACTTFREALIDACVLDLYFPEEATAKNPQHSNRNLAEKLRCLTAECESAHAPSNLFAVIKQEGQI